MTEATESQPEVFALHGFLGLPSDWRYFSIPRLVPVDLWQFSDQGRRLTLPRLSPERSVLLGYSMGGRLAMHEVILHPERYCGAIFISAHPGLKNDNLAERQQRLESDQKWAERFRHEAWSETVSAWNQQAVFKGASQQPERAETQSIELTRLERDFSRVNLARALESWSLGHQLDLREALGRLSIPILYLYGQEDEKFVRLAHEISRGPRHELKIMADVGHRLCWQKPHEFELVVNSWLKEHCAQGT